LTRTLQIHFLPQLVDSAALSGKTVVVIDILRATTTIYHALAAHAHCVVPFLTIQGAFQAAKLCTTTSILGGERDGVRIAGFQLGNSPSEYNANTVAHKTVLFTTTNGTRAMKHCASAKHVFLGAFNALEALCKQLLNHHDIAIVCAGTDGHITQEDVLFAGAVAHNLQQTAAYHWNDEAHIAATAWRAIVTSAFPVAALQAAFQVSRGGKNLLDLGHDRDLVTAGELDTFNFVAEYDLLSGKITRRE
jgi:2-phosphosulfolactate phosphatase